MANFLIFFLRKFFKVKIFNFIFLFETFLKKILFLFWKSKHFDFCLKMWTLFKVKISIFFETLWRKYFFWKPKKLIFFFENMKKLIFSLKMSKFFKSQNWFLNLPCVFEILNNFSKSKFWNCMKKIIYFSRKPFFVFENVAYTFTKN